jgi:hypothetical protein
VDTGIARRWAFTSAVPDIMSLSWSPDNRLLSYTSSDWTGRLPPAETTQILDTWSAGTLTSAPRVPLAPGAEWAGFLTTRIGLAVAPDPAAQHRLSLVAVSIRSGRIVRGLTRLPVQGLSTDNAYDGTEGTITADASGHYVLIAVNGPDGHGEILRWTFGSGHLALVTGGASRAAWG